MTILSETTPTARKAHTCSWCVQPIPAGSRYHRYRWVDGGDAGTEKMHPECFEAVGRAAAADGGSVEFTAGSYSRGCSATQDCPCEGCRQNGRGERPGPNDA